MELLERGRLAIVRRPTKGQGTKVKLGSCRAGVNVHGEAIGSGVGNAGRNAS